LLRQDVRLLTLTGTGGIGKTRLALQAAANVSDRFSDGVFWVPLAPLRDGELVAGTVAQALGLREEAEEAVVDTLARHLSGKRLLLLLDNLEHVIEASRAVASILVRAAPEVRMLATSREALRTHGEQLYEVMPLAVPEAGAETLVENDAVALFAARAQAADQAFRVAQSNATAVAEIVRHLDGLPLAIELAAARVRALSPTALLSRLDDRLRLLTRGALDSDERQRTLRATIEWSYDLLSRSEQILFERLGIFVGGCRLDAAQAVCEVDDELGVDVLDGIGSLLDKSLVRRRDDADGEPRYWMLESIREYALSRLADRAALDGVAEHHARYFAAFAQDLEQEWARPERDVWNRRFDADIANFRESIAWHRRSGHAIEALNTAACLAWLWQTRGMAQEGHRLIEACLGDARAPEDATTQGRVLLALGILALEQGRLREAFERSEEASRILRGSEREDLLVVSLSVNAGALADMGRSAEAAELAEEAEAVARDAGNAALIAFLLNDRAYIALAAGDLEAAEAVLNELLALGAPSGAGNRAMSLLNLSEVKIALGDFEVARRVLDEGLLLCDQYSLRRERPGLITNVALLSLLDDATDPGTAKSYASQAVAEFRASNDEVHTSAALIVLAAAEAALGNVEAARSAWGEAMAIRTAIGLEAEVATERLLIDRYLIEVQDPARDARENDLEIPQN
jgi:predicted ATPase